MLRVGILSVAHLHANAYVQAFSQDPRTELVGVWDHDANRAREYAAARSLQVFESREALLDACDASSRRR